MSADGAVDGGRLDGREVKGLDWSGRIITRTRVDDHVGYVVEIDQDQHMLLPGGWLQHTSEGVLTLDRSLADLATHRLGAATVTLPIIEERLDVGTRMVEDETVVVRTRVEEVDRSIDLLLRRETVDVERVMIDQFVDQAPAVRTEGDVTIVPVVEEVLVVEKRLKLREEIHIRRNSSLERDERSVTVRREQVEVDHVAPRNPS